VPSLDVGSFALDDAAQRAWWNGQVLPLTPIEWRLLRTLLQQPGRVFARAQLLDAIHADFRDVSDRAIDSHVKNLRRKLQAALPEHDCITAAYGVGYRLDMPGEGGDPAPG
jgi:two-component system response regulator BaeR